jgi:hypothetical protein
MGIGDAVLAVGRGETVLGGDVQAALASEIRRSAIATADRCSRVLRLRGLIGVGPLKCQGQAAGRATEWM